MKGKKILAGLAVASLVVCGGVGMAACCDDSTVVATAEEFAEAIANAEDGEVIKLTANIDIDSSIIIDKEITINLNGKTIEAGDEISNIAMFFVRNEGKLTFEGEGIVDAATSANDYSMAVWAYSGGEVVINNGTFTNLGGKSVEDNAYTSQHPTGRYTLVEEVASLALYLASDSSNNMTGQVIAIDGGWTLN